MVAGGVVVVGGLYVAPVLLGVFAGVGTAVGGFVQGRWLNATMARLPWRGESLKLNRFMLADVRLYANEAQGFALEVPHWPVLPPPPDSRGWIRLPRFHAVATPPKVIVSGDQALRAARHLLPRINRAGAKSPAIVDAVNVLEQSQGAEQLFGYTAFANRGVKVSALPASIRLALEMSLHEDDERRALEGELAELEDRWREAEEVAAIADDMFVPSGVTSMLQRLKGGRG